MDEKIPRRRAAAHVQLIAALALVFVLGLAAGWTLAEYRLQRYTIIQSGLAGQVLTRVDKRTGKTWGLNTREGKRIEIAEPNPFDRFDTAPAK